MLKFLAKIFGTKSEKDIKKVMPLVEETRKEGEKLTGLSNDELRGKTQGLRERIKKHLAEIDQKLAALHARVAQEPDMDLQEKESVFADIDKIEKDRNAELEKVLLQILPEAFAIVRETARRFRENEYLEVTAREHDRILAARHEKM